MTEIIDPSVVDTTPGTPPIQDALKPKHDGKNKYYNATIPVRLDMSSIIVEVLNHNLDVQTLLAGYGYSREKIALITSILAAAILAYEKHKAETGEKSGSHDTFEKNFTIAKKELSCLIKIARVALKNDKTKSEKLELYGKKIANTANILIYMQFVYDSILRDEHLVTLLSQFGYNQARIKDCQQTYLKALESRVEYKTDNAEMKAATRERDARMEELNECMYDYYAIAKVAYMQSPEFMDQII